MKESARNLLLLGSIPPGWLLSADGVAATMDYDFANNRFWFANPGNADPVSTTLQCTRASEGWIDNAAGVWTRVAANTLRISDKGLLIEEARTNIVLWCRDLTNAAWTASAMLALKDQPGIGGAANAASAITATANDATILQAITSASAARWTTAFIKRLAGTGAVSMTVDGGATWTVVTATAAWSRVAIPTQTLANPSVGFKLATSGDAIAVDMVQIETSNLFATSPIETGAAAVTRALDIVNVRPTLGSSYGFFLRVKPIAPITFASSQALAVINASSSNRATLFRLATTGVARLTTISGGTSVSASSAAAMAAGAVSKAAAAIAAGDQAVSLNGAAAVTSAGNLPVAAIVVILGSTNPASPASAYYERFALWPSTRPSNAALAALTA